MKEKLRSGALGALGGMIVMAIMAQTPMGIRSDGIQFTDGTVLTSADTRRAFYLTTDQHQGSTATTAACGDGFHMASLWEVLDVSNLRYAAGRSDAFTRADSGEGPPTGVSGWVRTGYVSGSLTEGHANCSAWTTSSGSFAGTVVSLTHVWDGSSSAGFPSPWSAVAVSCDTPRLVWCVED